MNKQEREEYLINRLAEMRVYEEELFATGIRHIGGVDEVGRGPLAGPVCAACVVLPMDFDVIGIDDSKKLSAKRRNELYGQIIEKADAYGIGLIDNNRIDEINILNATKEAMLIAVKAAEEMLVANLSLEDNGIDEDKKKKAKIEHLLVDALKLPKAGIPGTAIIKGDAKSVTIASASIVAKVVRDRIMGEFDSIYPGYAFASNSGYGTKDHYAGLRKLGITPIHRKTFLKNL